MSRQVQLHARGPEMKSMVVVVAVALYIALVLHGLSRLFCYFFMTYDITNCSQGG